MVRILFVCAYAVKVIKITKNIIKDGKGNCQRFGRMGAGESAVANEQRDERWTRFCLCIVSLTEEWDRSQTLESLGGLRWRWQIEWDETGDWCLRQTSRWSDDEGLRMLISSILRWLVQWEDDSNWEWSFVLSDQRSYKLHVTSVVASQWSMLHGCFWPLTSTSRRVRECSPDDDSQIVFCSILHNSDCKKR